MCEFEKIQSTGFKNKTGSINLYCENTVSHGDLYNFLYNLIVSVATSMEKAAKNLERKEDL